MSRKPIADPILDVAGDYDPMHVVNPFAHATAGGFVPTDIAGCVLWLDAESLALSDNDPVSTWTDLSGNGNSPTTGGTAPVWKPSVVNGRAAVRFAANAILQKAFTLNAPSTWFLVTKAPSLVQGMPPADGANNLSANFYPSDAATQLTPYSNGFGAGVSITWANANVIGQVWDGSSSLTSINGTVTAQSGMAASSNPGGVTIGGWGNGSNPYTGDILAAIVYDSHLATTPFEQVEDYLGGLFAITIL